MYYYSIASPTSIILAKIFYNAVLLFMLSFLSLALFSFIMGNPIKDQPIFFLAVFLGSTGLATALSFISAISAKAQNSATLTAILGFPVIIPVILTLSRLSRFTLQAARHNSVGTDLTILVSIDVIMIALAVLLFSYLWRD